jgi:hypothetical protein
MVQILYILSLMDITLKITITAVFVTTVVQTGGHTQSIGIFIIYLHNKLHMHNVSGSLVMVNKPITLPYDMSWPSDRRICFSCLSSCHVPYTVIINCTK